jgi:hypothetical protein
MDLMAGKKRRPDWYVFYRQQRGNAKLRGVAFELTAEEWWKIWQDSGKFEQRGQRSHQYCMARFGDVGPYAVGNVEIITMCQNNTIGSAGRRHSPETIKKMKAFHKGHQYCPHKLSNKQARLIRKLYLEGVKAKELGKLFNVHQSTIYYTMKRLLRDQQKSS